MLEGSPVAVLADPPIVFQREPQTKRKVNDDFLRRIVGLRLLAHALGKTGWQADCHFRFHGRNNASILPKLSRTIFEELSKALSTGAFEAIIYLQPRGAPLRNSQQIRVDSLRAPF
jgi:hypothetical protein